MDFNMLDILLIENILRNYSIGHFQRVTFWESLISNNKSFPFYVPFNFPFLRNTYYRDWVNLETPVSLPNQNLPFTSKIEPF